MSAYSRWRMKGERNQMVNDFKVRRLYRNRIYKAVFSALLILGLVLVVPGSFHKFIAAPLEDCDLDGYDDSTGVPVPWPGYDETKGDTPDGPAGSKTPEVTTTPAITPTPVTAASDTKDSNAAGSTSTKTGSGNSKITGSTKSDNSSKSQSSKNDSGKASTSEKASTSGVKSNSTTAAGSSKNTAKVTEKASGKSNNISQSVSEASAIDKINNSAQSNTQKVDSSKTENAVPGEDGNQKAVSQNTEEQPQVTAESPTESSDTAEEITEAINTKGSLNITEAAGSIIHAGSSIIISGSGFYKDLKNLEIVIQSEPRQLGVVESTQDGSFKAQFDIPKDLAEGTHHIVVLYQGKEITRQEIAIGPKAADSFWQALTVGFTSDNQGLIPGILILTGLLVLGAIVLGGNFVAGTVNKREESI